ncbi:hypothetical protein [Nostoc sp. 106C]|uniref:hypothetical protein n=1 Tax=Nostoc sp. 106C TaxID=1932667 RepID=UPI000A397D12|nr:hypothetical protein [Nostoc sp. 106C]OUL31935.1 hypothetical protein BV378_01325 [Nostoc sp. RF31YmG]OUL36291.1 hypothetical protein BV375_00360 [Nostoc sp. 106C]
MTSFSSSPRLFKGTIVGFDIANPIPKVIPFQYNPETLTRSLEPQMQGNDQAGSTVGLRLSGAAVESISLEIEMDATDQLEKGKDIAVNMGIYPQLSALEMLVYPASSMVIANTIMLAVGTIEIMPPPPKLTLFIWGQRRILPVNITSFSITEEAHDTNLNPIRAKVSLGMRVLSYSDLPITHPGYHLYLAHQVVKETMATLGTGTSLNNLFGTNIKLLS